jgi:mannose-6-phosphate isomerase-like protein (cupin superfamily)
VPNQPVTRGYVVGPGQGVPDRGPEAKASGRSTGGSLTVIEATIDGGPPRHTHSREDESFYVLTGVLDVECGQDRFRGRQQRRAWRLLRRGAGGRGFQP